LNKFKKKVNIIGFLRNRKPKLQILALTRHCAKPLLVAGLLCFPSVSNIFCPAELVDKQHFRSYNKHSSRLVLVLELVCIFHIRKNIGKRLSALFLLSYVRSWGKLLLIVI